MDRPLGSHYFRGELCDRAFQNNRATVNVIGLQWQRSIVSVLAPDFLETQIYKSLPNETFCVQTICPWHHPDWRYKVKWPVECIENKKRRETVNQTRFENTSSTTLWPEGEGDSDFTSCFSLRIREERRCSLRRSFLRFFSSKLSNSTDRGKRSTFSKKSICDFDHSAYPS